MDHIDLATPVAHIWLLRGIPSRIALMLGLSAAEVEKVVYYAGYIVTSVNEDERKRLLKDLEAEFQQKSKAAQNADTKTELKDKAAGAGGGGGGRRGGGGRGGAAGRRGAGGD